MIGANLKAIKMAEDRDLFKEAMARAGLDLPRSGYARSLGDANRIQKRLSFPLIIRPSRTLGGSGGNIAYGPEDFKEVVQRGLDISPVHEILIEESVIGWKEFELEVMRDHRDNVVIVCSIENFDPMGVHTGDSITVAPAQTLTDKEYQIMRDAALRVIREIGVDTGGSNIQFGVNPADGRMVVIEMNPRVSRSSALASKATGFPIAKIAAKLAVGYTLDEIPNDITRETPASFEPTIDYVVVKIPRFTFEKFPQAKDILTPQMKSVGEVMAIGRTFKESLQKAMRSLETGSYGFEEKSAAGEGDREEKLKFVGEKLRVPNAERLWHVGDAFRLGMPLEEIHDLSKIDPWFLGHIQQIIAAEREIQNTAPAALTPEFLLGLFGPAAREAPGPLRARNARGAKAGGRRGGLPRRRYLRRGIRRPHAVSLFHLRGRRRVQPHGAEEDHDPRRRPEPHRPGHRVRLLLRPRRLRPEGRRLRDDHGQLQSRDGQHRLRHLGQALLRAADAGRPLGVIVQFGGQTPLKLAIPLERAGVKIIGTSPDSIDLAEDRERFRLLLDRLELKQPESGTARSYEEAELVAGRLGYPVLVRPSYVLGGRAMEIVYDRDTLKRYMTHAVAASPEHPILIDKFLDDAIELDVDAIADGERVVIGGIMEHIERAGVHSGDSACSLPPKSIPHEIQQEIRRQATALALALEVRGLMNAQFAVKGSDIYVLEVNPRASRTVPFVSKATGVPLAKLAARIMIGKKLDELGLTKEVLPKHVSVKESVFPFNKFPGVDTILGPEMKSTGEVMGIDTTFGAAFAKAQLGGGVRLPQSGKVFISVRDEDKDPVTPIARRLEQLGFQIAATRGTAAHFQKHGVAAEIVKKVQEGSPNAAELIKKGEIAMVINTPRDAHSHADSFHLRRNAVDYQVPYFTTIAGADAAVEGIDLLKQRDFDVHPLQEYLAPLGERA